MAEVLQAIVELRKAHVAAQLKGREFDPQPTKRSLKQALDRRQARFIMEVCRPSPGAGRSGYRMEEAARALAPIADAISVPSDGFHFGGSSEGLAIARKHFEGPVLARDFIVDPVQVREARAAGADAILIIMSVLDDVSAGIVRAEADRLGMDALYEVHDEAEVARALRLGAQIIGINNRNRDTLDTDLGSTERLAPLVPEDVTLISQSGIGCVKDVRRLASSVDALLVGPSLMASANIMSAARELVFGPVKICGLARIEDVKLAATAGATHAGFIFAAGSPREVGLVEAEALIEEARSGGMKTVGVFRNSTVGKVAAIANSLKFDAVQLHGKEDAKFISSLREKLIHRPEIWGVCQVSDEVAESRSGTDRTLFDSCVEGKSGGTGRTFDWARIAGRADLSRAFVAGGIRPDNARLALKLEPYGLDVCSGVEIEPGIKCEAKLRRLFRALRPEARGEER